MGEAPPRSPRVIARNWSGGVKLSFAIQFPLESLMAAASSPHPSAWVPKSRFKRRIQGDSLFEFTIRIGRDPICFSDNPSRWCIVSIGEVMSHLRS